MASTMTLDSTDQHFNVRECNNCVRVVISTTKHSTYVHYDWLAPTGETSEGQEVRRWTHVDGSTRVARGETEAMRVATEMYGRAPELFNRRTGERVTGRVG